MAVKTCSQCGITKPWSAFYFVTSRGKPRANCTECVNRQRRQKYEDRQLDRQMQEAFAPGYVASQDRERGSVASADSSPPDGETVGSPGNRATAWLDPDGRHVWLSHPCPTRPLVTRLPSSWHATKNAGELFGFDCTACGFHGVMQIESPAETR